MWPISDAFRKQLTGPVQNVRSKLEVMDTDFNPVVVLGGSGLEKSFIDGVVDVDISRGTRRTMVMSLLNENAEFSPDSQWGGLFYVNRLVRLHRGLVVGGNPDAEQIEWVPLGTFMIDKTETLVERQMSTVVFSGSDLWKKFHKAQFTGTKSWAAGTSYNEIITFLCTNSGVTKYQLDPLSNRPSNSKNITTRLSFEKGETCGDALSKVATDWGLDIFFNPLGVLVSEDFRNPADGATVWTFSQAENELHYLVRYVNDDERLYNAVNVVGTADEENIYSKTIINDDPSSPINRTRIGLRMYRYESGVLGTQEAVDKSALTLFNRNSLLSSSLNLEAICNPALEGNDVVEINEPDFAKVNGRYRIGAFSVPLYTSKQKITVNKVVNVTTL
jgi:hypothetical protein